MRTFVWSALTYGVLNTGLGLMGCLLSGFKFLERIAGRVCDKKLTINDTVTVHLPALMILISGSLVLSEFFALSQTRERRDALVVAGSLAGIQELRASVNRHQRNWWLALTSALTWIILWRFSAILRGLRVQLDAHRAKVAAIAAPLGSATGKAKVASTGSANTAASAQSSSQIAK